MQVTIITGASDGIGAELARHGLDREVDAASNREIPVLARFDAELRPVSWSASGLYQAIKSFLARAAEGLEEPEAQQLRKASTHWLRHSRGAHALQGRDGHPALPLKVVQAQLGHAFAGTTSMYLRAAAGAAE